MKLFIKENFLYFISFFCCLIIVFYQFKVFIKQGNEYDNLIGELYNTNCLEYTTNDYNNINESDSKLSSCANYYKLLNREKADTYYIFFATFDEAPPIFPFFSILFVIIPAIYAFHIKVKKGNIKNILCREKYSKFLRKEYINSLLSSLIIPLSLMLLFILCYKFSGHFDINKTKDLVGEIVYTYNNYLNPNYYMIMFFVNLLLQSIFFINIVYIVDYKSEKILLTYIKSYLIFLGLQILGEVLRKLIVLINGTEGHHYVYLTNYWTYGDIDKFMLIPLIINLLLISITFYILYRIYSNKEKVLINNE